MLRRLFNIARTLLRTESEARHRREPITICRLGIEQLEDRLALDAASGDPFWYVDPVLAGDPRVGAELSLAADIAIFEESWMSEWEEAFLFTEGDANGDGYVNSADFYHTPTLGLNLQQVWILGDLNGDFSVDQSDIDTLAENLGMSNATWSDGDLDDDGSVDIDDLELAFAQYGLELAVVS